MVAVARFLCNKKCYIKISGIGKSGLRPTYHLKATIIYMTAIRSAIKAIDVSQSSVLFNVSLMVNSI